MLKDYTSLTGYLFNLSVEQAIVSLPMDQWCTYHSKRARTPEQFRELMASLHQWLEAVYVLKVAVDFGVATIKPFDGKFYFEKLPQRRSE